MRKKTSSDQRNLFGRINEGSDWQPSEPPSLDGIDEIGLDFETTGLRWFDGHLPVGVAVGYFKGSKLHTQYLPWGHRGGNLSEDTVRCWFEREVRGKHIINLNTRFEVQMAYKWGIDLEEQGCTVEDVGHSAALLDDWRRTFSLDKISMEFLGYGKVQADLEMEHMAEHHAGHVAEYACGDVELALKLHEKFIPLLAADGLEEVQSLENRVIYPICHMERQGAPINEELLTKWLNQTEQELFKTVADIKRETGIALRPQSSNDMAALFERLGIPITEFTETGAPSFEDSTLRKIDHPTIKRARRARKLTSLRNKYFLPYKEELKRFGVVRYSLNQLRTDEAGTVSGRLSSSAYHSHHLPDGVNVQQVMAVGKQIKAMGGDDYIVRELFVPGPGQKWFCADARQIEYRLFAHFANSKQLIEAYKKDPLTDFHNFVMEMVRKVAPETTRDRTKDLNFAKIYGAGIGKIASMLGMGQDEVRSFVASYNRTFPEADRLLRESSDTAEKQGYVQTILGRRTRFPGRQRLHKALNGIIQGSAADIMKQKLVELHEECRSFFNMRFTVHDEVDGDVPDEEAGRKVAEVLDRQSFDTRVPILWEAKCGNNWRECK